MPAYSSCQEHLLRPEPGEHENGGTGDGRSGTNRPPSRVTAALHELLRKVEAGSEGSMLASILLVDETGGRLLHGAAPSLPDEYNAAIDGIEIGASVGSCGAAAYLGHPVYVTDIETDPQWVDFRHLARAHGLRACWSTPITAADGRILGTFAVYHRAARSPTEVELSRIQMVSQTAADIIVRGGADA